MIFTENLQRADNAPSTTSSRETFYDDSARLKIVHFSEPSTVDGITKKLVQSVHKGRIFYKNPLVQIRAILPLYQQVDLVEAVEDLSAGDAINFRVAGRIPFQTGNQQYGLYWVHAEDSRRLVYNADNQITHTEAVEKGLAKRRPPQPLPDGISLHMLNVLDDTVFSLNEGKKQAISVSPIELAHKLVTVHRRAFASTHDPDQQDPYKVLEIISANPTIAAVSSTGDIAAVGLFQKDNRFTFAGIQLVEPTFFTDPTFEGKGLSTALRQETVRQIGSGSFTDPTLIFGESIRGSSFGLCLANDFLLGGDGNTISGDLGDAYAKIGNASGGNIGLMPMGLTYLIDPRLKV